MFTVDQIKEMDTIVLTEGVRRKIQEEMDAVVREKGSAWLLPFEVIFNTAVINFIEKDKIIYMVFNVDNDFNIEAYVYYHYRHNGDFHYILNCTFNIKNMNAMPRITYLNERYTGINEFAAWVQGHIVFTLSYLTYKSTQVKEITNNKVNTKRLNSGIRSQDQKQREKRELYIGKVKVKFVNRSNTTGTENETKRKYTTSWTVRGHHRTLKDGRQIFVRPYRKGENKQFKASTYLPHFKKGNRG